MHQHENGSCFCGVIGLIVTCYLSCDEIPPSVFLPKMNFFLRQMVKPHDSIKNARSFFNLI
jgi:hypothetical protein